VSPQKSIAHYRITSKLGEGGMGEVWRATDTKLSRDVAIKVLPEAFAADPDRLARFTREAQVLASLNHPNIAAIYGVEDRALVMELVDGATLAERIAQGPIPLEEALPIARQIADALEYAHEHGIIHRDLKPANIKITPEGRVKVLDFGLAKALSGETASSDPVNSPTLTIGATVAGVILGTAAYMSPEQAKGKPADRRSDIWAFGVVLAEMLTGRSLYTGDTISEILASVLKEAPALDTLPDATPPAILRLIRRCLERDTRRRLQAIGEARFLLEEPAEAVSISAAPHGRTRLWQAAAAVLTVVSLASLALLWRATRPAGQPLVRFSVDLGPGAVPGSHFTAVISPDGRRIAYLVRKDHATLLATRLLDQAEATVLSGTEDADDAFFSADGQSIGFFAAGKMKKVPAQGGAAATLVQINNAIDTSYSGIRGASWAEDGNIVACLNVRQLYRFPSAGGAAEPLPFQPESTGHESYRWPQVLPGGENVLISAGRGAGAWNEADIGVLSIKTGAWKPVLHGGSSGRYLSSGHLVYVRDGVVYAVRFDLARLATRGAPIPILEEVAYNSANGAGQFDFASGPGGHGTFLFLNGKTSDQSPPLVWLDAAGRQAPLISSLAGALTPRISPDGGRVALTVAGDIHVYDTARGSLTRVTFGNGPNSFPVWSADGKRIAFSPGRTGVWWVRADGSAPPERLMETAQRAMPFSFSPDGKYLALHQQGDAGRNIWILPFDTTDPDHPKPGKAELFLQNPANDFDPAFSPDGRWLAYASSESGSMQLFVRPFPSSRGAGKWQVSTDGGRFPVWSPVSNTLFYIAQGSRIMAADYTTAGDAFTPGKPRVWSNTPIGTYGVYSPYDIAPDGKRFAVFATPDKPGEPGATLHVTFLLNFFDELKRRLP
jgi:serine/threonine-protein kinase